MDGGSFGKGSIALEEMRFGDPASNTYTEWGSFGGKNLTHHVKFEFGGQISLIPTGADVPEETCGWMVLN